MSEERAIGQKRRNALPMRTQGFHSKNAKNCNDELTFVASVSQQLLELAALGFKQLELPSQAGNQILVRGLFRTFGFGLRVGFFPQLRFLFGKRSIDCCRSQRQWLLLRFTSGRPARITTAFRSPMLWF